MGYETELVTFDLANWSGASYGFFNPNRLADEILGQLDNGKLFLYLFRRFGYPCYGWDGYKEVCEYFLTTPEPDCCLIIRITGTSYEFGYSLSPEAEKLCYQQPPWHDDPPQDSPAYKYHVALEAAIRDLLRPVEARDTLIGVNGRVDNKPGWTEISRPSVKPSYMAGYGIGAITEAFRKPDSWFDLMEAILDLGEDNFIKGVEAALGILRGTT